MDFVQMAVALFFGTLSLGSIVMLFMGQYLGAAAAIALVAFYAWKSFTVVLQNRLAGRLRLGAYMDDLKPGPHWTWWLFDLVIDITTGILESDLPASPEKIYHGDVNKPQADGSPGKGVVPPSYVPALRVMFATKKITDKYVVTRGGVVLGEIYPEDSLLEGQAAEIELTYGVRVKKGGLRSFYENIGSMEEAKKDMDDHVTGGAVSRLQQLCPREAAMTFKFTAEEVRDELNAYIAPWGMEAAFVRIKAIGFSHEFNEAISAAAASIETAKKTVRDAEANRTKRIKEGQGNASAEKDLLLARADGLAKQAEVASTPGGQFAIANDTARVIARESTLVVSDSGVLGGMAQIGKVLSSQMTPAPTTTPPRSIILTDTDHVVAPTSTDNPGGKSHNRDKQKKGK